MYWQVCLCSAFAFDIVHPMTESLYVHGCGLADHQLGSAQLLEVNIAFPWFLDMLQARMYLHSLM